MANANTAFLQDANGNNILPASDWSVIQNKPTNLATTDQLGSLNGWSTAGITYKNGAYDWDHVNNGSNCAYRIADFGSFKIVEIRLEFGNSSAIGTTPVEMINLPAVVKPDSDIEYWQSTDNNIEVHFNGMELYARAINGTVGAGTLFSFHDMYFTTL